MGYAYLYRAGRKTRTFCFLLGRIIVSSVYSVKCIIWNTMKETKPDQTTSMIPMNDDYHCHWLPLHFHRNRPLRCISPSFSLSFSPSSFLFPFFLQFPPPLWHGRRPICWCKCECMLWCCMLCWWWLVLVQLSRLLCLLSSVPGPALLFHYCRVSIPTERMRWGERE